MASEPNLDALRRDPDPEFAERLRAKLRQQPIARTRHARHPLARLAAGVAVAAGIGFALTLPAVRAKANSFLALFREVSFVAVPIEPGQALERTAGLDLPHLIGDRVQVIEENAPVSVVSREQASASAGFHAEMPTMLPEGTVLTEIKVSGRNVVRVTADTTRLRQLLDALGLGDVSIPEELDGETAMITVKPMVMTEFAQGDRRAGFMQGPIPEVLLPAGVDLAQLGEIGLRMMGLPAAEAREFAKKVDWKTTLVVPVPPTATRFRQVLVGSSQGVEIEGPIVDPETRVEKGNWNLLLWSNGGRVYGIRSTMRFSDVLAMANSLQ
ncbi:MAG TPA: hypothetical protein VGQ37_09680 [Vicinamibacterales bacterium]|nr:hypothetical protein [Vicinamibacterales bacterium]